jgi:uncharacterized protein
MPSPENAIIYLEFPATDLPATKRFYQQVFGWKFTDYGPDYASFDDGHVTGGFTRDNPGPGTAPLAVIFNEDLEAARARVKQGGGAIVKDIFSFPGGRRFHFSDPSGNVLAVCTDLE